MQKIILILSLLFSFSTKASSVRCNVKINGKVVASGMQEVPQSEGEPEGTGHLLLANEGNLKIYVTNYPIMLVANYFEDEIVVESKHSSMVRTFLGAEMSAKLHDTSSNKLKAVLNTTIGEDIKIRATCIDD